MYIHSGIPPLHGGTTIWEWNLVHYGWPSCVIIKGDSTVTSDTIYAFYAINNYIAIVPIIMTRRAPIISIFLLYSVTCTLVHFLRTRKIPWQPACQQLWLHQITTTMDTLLSSRQTPQAHNKNYDPPLLQALIKNRSSHPVCSRFLLRWILQNLYPWLARRWLHPWQCCLLSWAAISREARHLLKICRWEATWSLSHWY